MAGVSIPQNEIVSNTLVDLVEMGCYLKDKKSLLSDKNKQ
jgi:hypothetical protein